MILHLLQVYLRIQVSFLPNIDKLLEGQAPPDQWGLAVLWPVVVEVEWVHFDQLGHCCLQDLELPDLELELGLQDPELDFRTLHCTNKLILSIRISRIGGIGSIHLFSYLLPNQIYLKVFLILILCYFRYRYINISFFSFGKFI